jgi:hypothetical protein
MPATAWAAEGPADFIPYPDWVIFGLALVVTSWWSLQAFDRPILDLGGVPTFPRYMTRGSQFKRARVLFLLVCLGIYALLVRYHKDLPELIKAVKSDWAEQLKAVIDAKDPSYLVAIIIASACFLTLLRVEARWNFLLLFRDIFYSWVSIPYLAKRIIDLINNDLVVPAEVGQFLPEARKDWRVNTVDFEKNPESMDRAWAELCYLHWWIAERRKSDHDTTFFSEKSFAWDEMSNEFRNLRLIMAARKEGLAAEDHDSSQTMDDIAAHRTKLGRLIACYLVFMNSTRESLIEAALQLGINLEPKPSENPLRYSAIYMVTVVLSVCVGVYLAAVGYDFLTGAGVSRSILEQDFQDVQTWIYLALGDYGFPIIGILALRYFVWLENPVRGYSILVAYAWIFLVAALLSMIGLSVMVELFGRNATDWSQFSQLCQREVRWSLGPALICVYVNHYMDRQTDHLRPDIGTDSDERPVLRVIYALFFTLLVMLTALPFVTTIRGTSDGSWELSKLRFVAMGTIFCVTLFLALVAQFALRKPRVTFVAGIVGQQLRPTVDAGTSAGIAA